MVFILLRVDNDVLGGASAVKQDSRRFVRGPLRILRGKVREFTALISVEPVVRQATVGIACCTHTSCYIQVSHVRSPHAFLDADIGTSATRLHAATPYGWSQADD
eukprot:SAG11_NODE_23083_length_395_cov_1.040541_1_plen_104_part_01